MPSLSEPPLCLPCSEDAMEYSKEFVTAVVLGKDLVPRQVTAAPSLYCPSLCWSCLLGASPGLHVSLSDPHSPEGPQRPLHALRRPS